MAVSALIPRDFPRKLKSVFCLFSCNAKFLWKRIPTSVKSENAELAQIWEVGRGLWLRDSGSVFRTIESNTWSDEIGPIMNAIKGKQKVLKYF